MVQSQLLRPHLRAGDRLVQRRKSSSTTNSSQGPADSRRTKTFVVKDKETTRRVGEAWPSSSDAWERSSSSMNDEHRESTTKEKFSRRTSSSSDRSLKTNLRPPSSPVERRCQRIYSSSSSSINRETCQLLGPELCSDCREIQLKDRFHSDQSHPQLIQEQLFRLSLASHLPPSSSLRHPHPHPHQQIHRTRPTEGDLHRLEDEVMTDEEYFRRLSANLKRNSPSTQFFFRDFNDLTNKYRSNSYPRLLLSETPVPHSSNEVFQHSRAEFFAISPNYSHSRPSSRKIYPMRSNAPIFISPRKSEQFFSEHRFLQNYSPPLLVQPTNGRRSNHLQQRRTNNSFTIAKHSLIASKIAVN